MLPNANLNWAGPFRVDFNAGLWEQVISAKGYNISVSHNMMCPCVDAQTNHPVPNCTNCNGRGFYYYETVTTKGIITRQNHELDMGNQIGTAETGEAYLTVIQPQMLSVYDKVTNLDSTVIYTEAIFHDASGDSLRFVPVGTVVAAVTQPTKSGPLINFVQNTDYTIDNTGNITWSSSVLSELTSGQVISFRYWYNPTWIVQELINMVRDTNVINNQPQESVYRMPIRARIKLETQLDKS